MSWLWLCISSPHQMMFGVDHTGNGRGEFCKVESAAADY